MVSEWSVVFEFYIICDHILFTYVGGFPFDSLT